MVGIYFSGTGNTKFCVEEFIKNIDKSGKCISIEEESIIDEIKKNDFLVLGYPIYYSTLPKILKDFLVKNREVFKGKDIFIICTMGLFSGDGSGCSGRLLKKFGANIIGGLHLKMPDCIGDVKLLKKTKEKNLDIIKASIKKIERSASKLKESKPTKEGLGFMSHIAGLIGQRIWFYRETKEYKNKVKVSKDKCSSCNKCVGLCPMNNLKLENNNIVSNGKCTLCYRCFSNCPNRAITIIGRRVYQQNIIENYFM